MTPPLSASSLPPLMSLCDGVMIRRSVVKDGPSVMRIWRDAVRATHDFLAPEDFAAIEKQLADFLPSAPLWLAVDAQDQPLAFMLLDGGHMEALFIDPTRRGCGVGRALVEYAMQLTGGITTDVNEQNQQVVGFYTHMGFVRTGWSARDNQGRPYPLIHLMKRA